MGAWKWLSRILGTRQFRGEVAGCLFDVRVGTWGNQTVLVDGAPASEKPWAALSGSVSHFFTFADSEGKQRNVEVKVIDRSGGLMVAMRVEVSLDGRAAAPLSEVGSDEARGRCPRCGYSLEGLAPVNDEIKCPECGRHTPSELLR